MAKKPEEEKFDLQEEKDWLDEVEKFLQEYEEIIKCQTEYEEAHKKKGDSPWDAVW